eukprot:4330412-Alexandrium_andersonii.AAC.1
MRSWKTPRLKWPVSAWAGMKFSVLATRKKASTCSSEKSLVKDVSQFIAMLLTTVFGKDRGGNGDG